MQQKTHEKLFVSEIISSELVSLNCPSEEQYFSSTANVLRSNPENLHVNKRDFSQLN